ncbi:MAG TPA: biotin/lipoyl-containing protein, partial [Verrucomicrobiae bacterium]|nr:biotin/lipoyl-containing protein [Verrucomicrobiae bacterium]
MQIELKVPSVGESITEVEIGQWLKNEGDAIAKDESVVVIESEKTTLELPAPAAGILQKILKKKGETAKVGELIGLMEPGALAGNPEQPAPAPAAVREKPSEPNPPPAPAPQQARVMPAAARAMAEHAIKSEQVQPTGPGGRILKEDVLKQLEKQPPVAPSQPATLAPTPVPAAASAAPSADAGPTSDARQEQI